MIQCQKQNCNRHLTVCVLECWLGVECRGSDGVRSTTTPQDRVRMISCPRSRGAPGREPEHPRTLPSLRRLRLRPGADTHLAQKGPPGSAAQTRPRWRGAELGKVTGPAPGRLLSPSGIPGAADMIRRSTSSTAGERILAEVQLRPRGVCKTRGWLEPALARARNPAPPHASGRRLQVRSEPAVSQGHCPPAASARSSVPARVPPQAAGRPASRALVAAPPPLRAGVPRRRGALRAWLRLRARRPLMVHSVYLCLDSN